MIGYVGSKIRIENPSKALIRWCNAELMLDNPEYYKRERMGKWIGNTPRKIALYERLGDTLYLPFGCAQRLLEGLSGSDRLYSEIQPVPHIEYQSEIKPFDYQEVAIQKALEMKNGVLVMPCGAGKTQTALEIVSRIGMPCLWLTHTQDLLYQSMNRAKSVLGIANGSYGVITGGKVNIGCGITFATIQTMAKLDLAQYRDMWGVVIVDECHHAIGSPTKVMQFYKVLSNISARYKIGLTATPERADGLQKSMFALLGEIIYTVTKEDTAKNVCSVNIVKVSTHYMPDLDMVLAGDGTINYSALVDDLIHNEERFKVILDTALEIHEPALVLANRVEYLKKLSDEYCRSGRKAVCLSGVGMTIKAKEERKEALRKLNNGEIDCVFATYQLAKEGLDVPNLRYVLFATPEKDPTTVKQAAGRVERKAEGKERGTVIDFIDNFGMYKGWAKKRDAIYKKCKFIIDIV